MLIKQFLFITNKEKTNKKAILEYIYKFKLLNKLYYQAIIFVFYFVNYATRNIPLSNLYHNVRRISK